MRRALHRVLVTLAVFAWGIGNAWYTLALWLTLLADRVMPDAMVGNCWSYAGPRWWRRGGYLLVRPADGNTFLGCLPVPHVIWVRELPRRGVELEQFVPLDRKMARWWPWHTAFYAGEVRNVEAPHPARDADA